MKAKKLPSGSWRVQVFDYDEQLYDDNGNPLKYADGRLKKKHHYKSFTCNDPSPAGKRKAELMAAEYANSKVKPSADTSVTFEYAFQRLQESRRNVLSPATLRADNSRVKKLSEGFRFKRLSEITEADIQRELNAYAIDHSPKSTKNLSGQISKVLSSFRPEFSYHVQLPSSVRYDIHVPTDDEVKRLIEASEGTDLELPILLAAFGPMRRGEICALTSNDIKGNTVHVRKNMVRGENKTWIIKSPKTYAGNRYIQFPDFVGAKLKGIEGRIFDMNPDDISRAFSKMLDDLGMEHFRFHDLRHYSASIQHSLGIPDVYIMQRGGWSDVSTLQGVYRHAMSDRENTMNDLANDHFSSLHNTKHNTK